MSIDLGAQNHAEADLVLRANLPAKGEYPRVAYPSVTPLSFDNEYKIGIGISRWLWLT